MFTIKLYFIYSVRLLVICYSCMILIRVLSSWFPTFQRFLFIRFVAHYVDPYLNFFRRFIPPIGGVIDLSPLLGFFFLKIIEKIIFWLLI